MSRSLSAGLHSRSNRPAHTLPQTFATEFLLDLCALSSRRAQSLGGGVRETDAVADGDARNTGVTVPTVIHAYIPYIKDVENGPWAREAGCAAAPGAVTGVGLWRVWARACGGRMWDASIVSAIAVIISCEVDLRRERMVSSRAQGGDARAVGWGVSLAEA